MKKEKYNVAVAGATGAVGNEMVSILQERNFPVGNLKLLASTRGAGTKMEFKGKEYTVEVMNENSFSGVDIGLFSPGGSVSEKFAPIAGKAGCVVIDNTSAFRMDPQVPLVVPEVNAHAIAQYPKKNIISNPNCSTIQMVVALKPIHDVARIKRVVSPPIRLSQEPEDGRLRNWRVKFSPFMVTKRLKSRSTLIRSHSTVFPISMSSSTMVTPRKK